jgi:copper chaperone CopZ
MKKTYQLEDLDCANCAAKMEAGIKAIPGVTDAHVNFLSQKMTVEAPEEGFDALMDQIVKVCRKIEPDCVIKR